MAKATTPYNQFSYLQHCTPTAPFHLQSGLQVSAILHLPFALITATNNLLNILYAIQLSVTVGSSQQSNHNKTHKI